MSKARLKWDTAYYQRQLGRLPVAKPWQWEQSKSLTGYDAQEPLTVLAHAWYCWGTWLEVFRRPNNDARRYVRASVLARRVMRGWRHWTIQEKLLAPTWQQVRLKCEAAPSSSHASRFDSPADCDRRTTGAREGSTRNVPLRCIPVANQSATA